MLGVTVEAFVRLENAADFRDMAAMRGSFLTINILSAAAILSKHSMHSYSRDFAHELGGAVVVRTSLIGCSPRPPLIHHPVR